MCGDHDSVNYQSRHQEYPVKLADAPGDKESDGSPSHCPCGFSVRPHRLEQ